MTVYNCSICGKTHTSDEPPCPQTFSVGTPMLDIFMQFNPVLRQQWASFLKWGLPGPPVGALVVAIRAGFNCGAEGGTLMRVINPEPAMSAKGTCSWSTFTALSGTIHPRTRREPFTPSQRTD